MKRNVVLTRPQGVYPGGIQFSQRIRDIGFDVFECAPLACEVVTPSTDILTALSQIAHTGGDTWFVFLSPTAVFVWRELVGRYAELPEAMSRTKFAVQGRGTEGAVSECFGRKADFIPTVFVAEEFAEQFKSVLKEHDTVILPQSAQGRNVMAPLLEPAVRQVIAFSSYSLDEQMLSVDVVERLRVLSPTDIMVFMSPSAVRAMYRQVGDPLERISLLSIGPSTSREMRACGLSVWREAQEYSEQCIIELLQGVISE